MKEKKKNKVFPIRNQKLPIWSMYLKAGLGFLQKSVTLKWLWAHKDRCAGFPSQELDCTICFRAKETHLRRFTFHQRMNKGW